MKKTGKKILFLLVLLLAGLICAAHEVNINGKLYSGIVIPAKAAKYELLAARELSSILLEMTGKSIRIVRENEKHFPGNAIYIGATRFAAEKSLSTRGYGKEEWELEFVKNAFIIQGGFPIGALYGVYAFLEKNGVYFLSFDQSVIPRKTHLKATAERKRPAFDGRSVYASFVPASQGNKFSKRMIRAEYRFRLRNGISSGDEYKGIYSNVRFGTHTFYYYVSPKLFKTHPEYFAMAPSGKRFRGRLMGWQGGSICLTNKEVWKITLDSLRKFIREDRSRRPKEEWPLIYDLSQMDNIDYLCKCPECKKVTEEEGSDAGLLLRYVNHVAREIRKEYPEILLRTFAYVSTEKVPKITKPEKNVIIFVCDVYSYSDPFKPLTHKVNEKQLAKLKAWTDLGAHVKFWDYLNFFENFPPRLDVTMNATPENMKLLRKMGVKAIFNEFERGYVSPQAFFDFHIFAMAQLMMDPRKDPDKLADIFFKGYYGAAAPLLRKYYERLKKEVAGENTAKYWVGGVAWNFSRPAFAIEIYDLLKKAEKQIAGKRALERRIREEMIPVLLMITGNPETVALMKKRGITRETLTKELKHCMEEYRRRYEPSSDAFSASHRKRILSVVESNIPVPEKFRSVPSNKLFVIGHPFYRTTSSEYMKKLKTSDTASGMTFQIVENSPRSHIIETKPAWRDPRFFGIHNFDLKGTSGQVHIGQIPQDEKYHWYCIRNARIGSRTWFWGLKWQLTINISHSHILSDGNKEINTRDVWFNAKYEGPLYVKGSKKKNSLSVELVVVTPPGAVK